MNARAPRSALPAAALTAALVSGAGAVVAALLALSWTLLAATGLAGGRLQTAQPGAPEAPVAALAGIPPLYLSLYIAAARRYGLDWAVLAAVGEVECDHGRDPDPSCSREGAVNAAGAGGPAQFLPGTWRAYGVDGNGDGTADRWDPADAIFSMAAYLRASGAPADYRGALFAYNHSWRYVTQVERWAARYRDAAAAATRAGGRAPAPDGFSSGDAAAAATRAGDAGGAGGAGGSSPAARVQFVAGTRAVLSPVDGHLALVPAQAPAVVQAMVMAGNELQDLPYGPAGHPDPRGASSEDCSSAVSYVLYRSGVRSIEEIVREDPLAQDYVRWGEAGLGRWVSIYATTAPTDHVFIVIAGLRLDTSHAGTDVGPNRLQDGPRWRVLDHIPTWARWTIRHPAGL